MKKNIEDVCIVVQARLGSERVPGKMLKPFSNSNLVDILFKKLKNLKNIPQSNIFLSAHEEELKEVAKSNRINIYERSKKSAESRGPSLEIFNFLKDQNYKC